MKSSNPMSDIIALILLILLCVFAPLIDYRVNIENVQNYHKALNAQDVFLGKATTSRQIIQEDIRDLELSLQSLSEDTVYEICVQKKVAFPDGTGGVEYAWITTPAEVGQVLQRGDIVSVEINVVKSSAVSRALNGFLGVSIFSTKIPTQYRVVR